MNQIPPKERSFCIKQSDYNKTFSGLVNSKIRVPEMSTNTRKHNDANIKSHQESFKIQQNLSNDFNSGIITGTTIQQNSHSHSFEFQLFCNRVASTLIEEFSQRNLDIIDKFSEVSLKIQNLVRTCDYLTEYVSEWTPSMKEIFITILHSEFLMDYMSVATLTSLIHAEYINDVYYKNKYVCNDAHYKQQSTSAEQMKYLPDTYIIPELLNRPRK